MKLDVKYPLGIQTFSQIREQDYLYVDKTALIHELIHTGKAYFLSRPRSFGKSLLISTFEALFSGQRILFNDLDIAKTSYDFANIPYNITLQHEKYYQSLFYALFTLIGFQVDAEVHTNQGRIDCVLQTRERVYIIEFHMVNCS